MDDEQVLRDLDEQLQAMFSDVTAPANFSALVHSRTRPYKITKLPEILDVIGWAGILAATFVLLVHFAPAFYRSLQ